MQQPACWQPQTQHKKCWWRWRGRRKERGTDQMPMGPWALTTQSSEGSYDVGEKTLLRLDQLGMPLSPVSPSLTNFLQNLQTCFNILACFYILHILPAKIAFYILHGWKIKRRMFSDILTLYIIWNSLFRNTLAVTRIHLHTAYDFFCSGVKSLWQTLSAQRSVKYLLFGLEKNGCWFLV